MFYIFNKTYKDLNLIANFIDYEYILYIDILIIYINYI